MVGVTAAGGGKDVRRSGFRRLGLAETRGGAAFGDRKGQGVAGSSFTVARIADDARWADFRRSRRRWGAALGLGAQRSPWPVDICISNVGLGVGWPGAICVQMRPTPIVAKVERRATVGTNVRCTAPSGVTVPKIVRHCWVSASPGPGLSASGARSIATP